MILKRIFGRERQEPDRTEAIFERHLDSDFILYPYAPTRCTADHVAFAEKELGVKLPPQFVAHICGRYPGVRVEAKEAIWPRPKPLDVAPFWSILYGFETYTVFPESEPWMRIDVAAKKFQRKTGIDAVPILRIIGDADLYCATSSGRIARFRHEEGELEPLTGEFWELFEAEVRWLRERKDEKLASA